MIPYIAWGVVAFVLWLYITLRLRDKAYANRTDKTAASHARLAVLSVFLLPVYPVVALIFVIGVIINDFRRLGRLDQEENE